MIFPYLNFSGQCEEALKLYERAFGGHDLHLRRYGEYAPDPSLRDKVMHAEMDLGESGRIAAADAPYPVGEGATVHIIYRATEEKLRSAWAVLAEEGTVVSDLAPFEIEDNALMGTITDKFGFIWIFT